MEKTVNVAMFEMRHGIEEAIEQSGLPASVVEPVLAVYAAQLREAARQQTVQELQEAQKQKEAGKDAQTACETSTRKKEEG